jgi:hypothetical protein
MRDECVESFQWLSQEVRQARGEALVMRVDKFEEMSDAQLIELFHGARKAEYQELDREIAQLEKNIGPRKRMKLARQADKLKRLRRRHADIARVDFFNSPEGTRLASRLALLQRSFSPEENRPSKIAAAVIAKYRKKRWVTRPHPHVDRLACAWLIRRFIEPKAAIRYSLRPDPDEITFDMAHGHFGHVGNLCTFETMVEAFGLDQPGLQAIAEIVHEIDLRDGRYARPETSGVDAILKGWSLAGLPDDKLESRGIVLFEGLFIANGGTNEKARNFKNS